MSKVWTVTFYDVDEMEKSVIGIFSTLDNAKSAVIDGLSRIFDDLNEELSEGEEDFDWEDAEEDEQDWQDEYLNSLKANLEAISDLRKKLMNPTFYSEGNYFQIGEFEINEFEVDKY